MSITFNTLHCNAVLYQLLFVIDHDFPSTGSIHVQYFALHYGVFVDMLVLKNPFNKSFMSFLSKSYINTLLLKWFSVIQSGHNFAHVMTAMLSWHVQNYYMIG